MASFFDKSDNYKDFVGMQPSADYVSGGTVRRVFDVEVPEFLNFIQARTSQDSVSKARKMAASYSVRNGEIGENPFFVSDGDVGFDSEDNTSYALVRPGEPGSPVRIILAHTDSPCLRITPQPVYIESDADYSLAYPSFSLLTRPYGGIRTGDWQGMDVDIVGQIYGSKVKEINIPGRIKQKSIHVESEDEERRPLGLRVDTGIRKLKDLYSTLGIKDGMDFARAKLYAVPNFSGTNGRLVGNELGAYGLDDRACLWAATKAGLEEMVKPSTDNTLMIFGLDKEEIGSSGGNSSYSGFFEYVLNETMKVVHGKEKFKELDLPLDFRRGLLGNYPVISGDGDVALGDLEIENVWDTIDFHNSSKIGWGPFIYSVGPEDSQQEASPKHISNLIDLFDKGLNVKNPRDKFQVIGNCATYDSGLPSGTLADIFDKSFPCVNVGLPMIGLHSPRSEVINVFDLHWLKEGYQLYFGAD
jgi:aspartyl aminopeptidase